MQKLVVPVLAAALLLPACQRRDAEPPPPTASVAPTAAKPGTVTAAIEGALSIPDPLARAATLIAVIQGLGPDAVPETVTAIEYTIDETSRASLGVELALLVEWWARHDAPGAYAWFRAHPWARSPALDRSIVRAWATRDPAAASAAVGAAVRDRGALVAGLVEGWFDSGRDGVEDYLVALPPNEDQQVAIGTLARRKVRRDGIEATLGWAEALPDDAPGRFKLQTYRRVGSAVAEVDPEQAAAWVERQLDGEFWEGLARRVAVRWAERDGRAAMTWLETLPPEKLELAVDETYRVWRRRAPDAARAWLDEAVGKPALEPAVAFHALTMLREGPEAALTWANKVSDERLRRDTLVRIGIVWMRRDAEAAQAWLEASELGPAEREQIVRRAAQRRGDVAQPGAKAEDAN
jgi:hypothetical protein